MHVFAQTNERLFFNASFEYLMQEVDNSNNYRLQEILGIVIIAFIPFIIVSNSLIFWSTIACTQFHNPMNMFIFSLCIADLTMGCFCIPVFSVCYLDRPNYLTYTSDYYCMVWFASSWISAGGSLVSLLYISMDRYLAIMWPNKYTYVVTTKRSVIVVASLWVYILLVACLPIFDWDFYLLNIGSAKRCNYFSAIPKHYSFFFTFVTIHSCFVIPVILHIMMCVKILQQVRVINHNYAHTKKEIIHSFDEEVSTVIISLSLTLLFVLLWLPYLVIVSFGYFNYFYEKQYETLQDIAQVFYFANAMCSAPVYALARRDYKCVYVLMLSTPPWKWKSHFIKLNTQKKVPAFRYPSCVSIVRPTISRGFKHEQGHARGAKTSSLHAKDGKASMLAIRESQSSLVNGESVID